MATLRTFVTLVAVLVCIGKRQFSAAESLDEMKARLSSLEASQQSMQDSLGRVEKEHVRDVDNITQFCQGLQIRVEAQQEIIEEIQEAVGEKEEGGVRHGACDPNNYKIIDDTRREVGEEYNGYDHICDRDIEAGYYRFLLNGDNAIIPTYCVPERNCQTHASTWVDLQGQSLPAVGQQVDARACSNWVGDCCNWDAPITVHNCGDYFVYDIHPLPVCHLAFCAEHE